MLASELVSPLYVAVRDSVPVGRLLFVRVATPPTNVTVARLVVPFLKMTFPVGGVGPVDVTDVVSVTDCPKAEGFKLEARLVEVAHLSTTCVKPAEVLVLKVASPEYLAVMVLDPTAGVEMVNEA